MGRPLPRSLMLATVTWVLVLPVTFASSQEADWPQPVEPPDHLADYPRTAVHEGLVFGADLGYYRFPETALRHLPVTIWFCEGEPWPALVVDRINGSFLPTPIRITLLAEFHQHTVRDQDSGEELLECWVTEAAIPWKPVSQHLGKGGNRVEIAFTHYTYEKGQQHEQRVAVELLWGPGKNPRSWICDGECACGWTEWRQCAAWPDLPWSQQVIYDRLE